MYSVSAAYKQAIKSGHIKSRVEITITPAEGQAFLVEDENILPGSFSVNNRATNSGEFGYGSVYVGQMNLTLIDVDEVIDRYSLFGAMVEPVFIQVLSPNEEERIPLGVFFVNTPTRKQKTISIECYDSMTAFDKQLTESTFGTPYELLVYLCEFCGVTLGMSQVEVEAMPNGDQQFTLTNYQNMTARDALSGLAKVLCGFATIDRSGELVIRRFSTVHCDEVSAGSRISSTIADYQTYFVAVTGTVRVGDEEKSITALTGREDGLMLDLGNLQIAQGTQETMRAIMQNIADELADVIYTPVQCEIISNPAYDLGDMLLISDVNNTTDDVSSVVTSLDWKYHSRMKVVSDGRNALLNAVKSAEAKLIDEVNSTIYDNAYNVKTYTNSAQLNIGSTDMVVAQLNYSVNKNTTTVFLATFPLYMSLDGEVVFGYHLNNDPVQEVTTYLERGWNAVTLSNYFQNESQSQNRLVVTCRTAYFESDKRKIDSRISGLIDAVTSGTYEPAEIDTTIPGATILATTIKAILFASGINVTESWDGTLLVIDEFGAITLSDSGITVKPIDDSVVIATSQNNGSKSVTEQIAPISLGNSLLTVKAVVEAINMGRKVLYLTINTERAAEYTYSRRFVSIVNDAFNLNELYPSPSEYDTIDSGALKKCECDVTGTTPSAMTIVATGEQGGGGHQLPSGYQEVEYIDTSNTGRCFISTQFLVTDKTRIVADMQEVTSNNYPRLFANGNLSGYGKVVMEFENGVLYVKFGMDASYINTNVSRDYVRHEYEIDKNIAYIDGVQVAQTTAGTFSSYGYLGIFAMSATAAQTDFFKGKLFSFKIYDDGVLVRDYVPCYRISDSVIGLYDLVNSTFATNTGYGTLAKGPDVQSGPSYKTLITDGTDVYSISGGTLGQSVGLLVNLSASMFQAYGFDSLNDCVVAESDLFALGEFSILRWCSDGTEVLSSMLVTITAVPGSQEILTPVFNITNSHVTGIELTTTDTDGNPRVEIKFDSGSWEYYDTIDEDWCEIGQGSRGYMTIADLEDLTEEIWAEKFETASTMQTKLILVSTSDAITEVQYKFLQEEE